MDEESILNFVAITSCDPDKAAQYLQLAEGNLEAAIQLYFDSPNLDVGAGTGNAQGSSSTAPPARSRPSRNTADDPITIDSDDEDMSDFDAALDAQAGTPPVTQSHVEDDEAMARRLQEEIYGEMPAEGDVRAPMARTTETLVGPGSNWGPPADAGADLDALVQQQLAARRRPAAGRPGIFNQRASQAAVWENENGNPEDRRRNLSAATGGASESSHKSNLLAEMYRPPFEIMSQYTFERARDEGKEEQKWIIVNVQDPAIFDCQVLNRDIWKNKEIKATIKENFLFLQYSKDDTRGEQYINYYFPLKDSQDAYPHIAIVDPRTGEQVKVWSGPPVPKPMEFLSELHEFLDRYSLDAKVKNPVATRKPERTKVDVNRMTEEEMLEMAMQNSLTNNAGPKAEDPDALTKGPGSSEKGKDKVPNPVQESADDSADSPFAHISSSNPHTEPAQGPGTTRIQFRSPDGKRQVRRFDPADPVRRIYEWLKASPWEGKEGIEFELVFFGKNLIDFLDSTIEEAGLKNGSINLEFME